MLQCKLSRAWTVPQFWRAEGMQHPAIALQCPFYVTHILWHCVK